MKRVMFLLLLAMAAAPEAWAQSWPNEPAGSTVLSDHNWSSCPGGGWQPAYGCSVIRSDATAPQSPSSVLAMEYNPANGAGGGDPYINLNNLNEVYVGTWFKFSNPFQGEQNLANKLMVLFWGDGSTLWIKAEGQQFGPWHPVIGYSVVDMTLNNCHNPGYGDCPGGFTFTPNVSNGNITQGMWNRLEFYYKRSTSTTSRDGIVRVWLNGTPVIDVTRANTPSAFLQTVFVTPSWAGPADPGRSNPDKISFDHIHVSAPNGGGGAPKGDTTPPAAPVNLSAH
jgi:hypothetical protein